MAGNVKADQALIPELEQRREDYEAAKRRVRDLVDGLEFGDEDFKWRPGEGEGRGERWSIAECVDHLLVMGKRMVPRLEAAIEEGHAKGGRRLSSGPFRYGALGNWFVRLTGDAELPPKKVKVPRIYRPAPPPDRSLADSVIEFDFLQDQLIELAERADGLDLKRIRVTSPVSRLVRLSLGQWLELCAAHQRRHLWQAERVKDELIESRKRDAG